MQVNRPSSSINTQPTQVDAEHSAPVSSTRGFAAPSRVNLKSRVTPRTEDYLQRLRAHGNSTQRALANSACKALENDRFIANPARDKPVVQFGVSIVFHGEKGILLANFTPHDDKLELEALAFRAERFFETEISSMEKVVMEHAQALPEVKAVEHSIGAPAKLPEPNEQSSQGDIAAEQKALKKDAKRYQRSMHRQMAGWVADRRVDDGLSTSRFTALPIAHAQVAGGQLRQLVTALFQQMLGKRDALEPHQPSAPIDSPITTALGNPRGQQYEFGIKEFADFADFCEDHEISETSISDLRDGLEPVSGNKRTELPSSDQSSSLSSSRRNARIFDDKVFLEDLSRRVGDELEPVSCNKRTELPSSGQSSPLSSSRRDAKLIDNKDFLDELSRLIKDGQAPT